MKTLIPLVTILAVILLIEASRAGAQDTPSSHPVLPLSPQQLIKLLPVAPKGWALKESKASNFSMSWVMAVADREFDHVPDSGPSGGAPHPVEITRIQLRDTGGYLAFLGMFRNFKVGEAGGEKSFLIQDMPAHEIISGNGTMLSVLVCGRFILQIEVQNQAPAVAVQDVSLVDLTSLKGLPAAGTESLPSVIEISSIDELHPERNTHSELRWMSNEAIQAALMRPKSQ